jgi:hypothetical protein
MNAQWSSDLSWDVRVVYLEGRRRWWWNAWLAATETELWGFADSQEAAYRAMQVAIREAGSGSAPDRPHGGAR